VYKVRRTSDVPAGVVNLLTGDATTLGPWLAAHMDINAIDLVGIADNAELATKLEVAAADNLKRSARRRHPSRTSRPRPPSTR
jgi:acyl-CoA reductase-like NAD-dependent aldehyde dehydrogenase